MLSVIVYGDVRMEPDASYTISLGTPTNAAPLRSTGTITILNDD
jgi:hypothetical protein